MGPHLGPDSWPRHLGDGNGGEAHQDEEPDTSCQANIASKGRGDATPGRSAASYSGAGESVRDAAIVGGGAEQGAGAASVTVPSKCEFSTPRTTGRKQASLVVLGNLDDYKGPTYAPTAVRCVMC